jgi:hypothetical protein
MAIQFSRVDRLPDGFLIDPRPYIEMLPSLKESLPAGAYKFVADPEHYDFFSERSIKDLKIERLEMVDSYAVLGIALELAYNQLPNVPRLSIKYSNVSHVSIEVKSGFQIRPDWINIVTKRLGDVLTDEIHPDTSGCVHSIEMIHGAISIGCSDLEAVWS